jgi:tRNA(Ile)-lysidine synthase
MPTPAEPIRPDELDGLFARFFAASAPARAALAVSGGSDSTALMVLFADWLRRADRSPGDHVVLTVDHGLRPESAGEAREVGARAGALGFRHQTLVWEGPKPATGLQAAARLARYRLMADYARVHGLALVLTGHTADDQAETLIMRLARGSGLDGLAAMAPLSALPVPDAGDPSTSALSIARPLLEVPKARLRATLESRDVPWIEDPSNEHPAFERTRLRAAREGLEALGLSADKLGLSARRLQRAREAVERAVADFCAPDRHHVAVDPCGVIRIDGDALRAAPAEIVVRVLSWAVAGAGGSQEPVALANIEAVAEALRAGAPIIGAWTLARAKITATAERILIEREPGREPLPEITLEPGARALWDGRFLVAADAGLAHAVVVRALGAEGVRAARSEVGLPSGVSAAALRALPAFWRAECLIAAPNLAFWPRECARDLLSAAFIALGNYNSGPGPGQVRAWRP